MKMILAIPTMLDASVRVLVALRDTCRPLKSRSGLRMASTGCENALRANPQDLREQYEKQLRTWQEAYGEAMLELRARKQLQSLLGEDEK